MQPTIWYSHDVFSAVAACRQRLSILVVLIEPASSVMSPTPDVASSEPLTSTHARSATAAWNRVTFASPVVREAVEAAGAVCLRLQDEHPPSRDFADFCAVFDVPHARPAVFLIGPNGRVHAIELAFLGPRAFVERLTFAQNVVRDPSLGESAATAAAALLAAAAASRPAATQAVSRNTPMQSASAQCSITNRAACEAASIDETATTSSEDPQNSARTSEVLRHQEEQGAVDPEAARLDAVREDDANINSGATSATVPPASNVKSTPPTHLGAAAEFSGNRMSRPAPMQLRAKTGRNTNTKIAVRLPDGTVLRRSFCASDRFCFVRTWVADESKLVTSDFALSTSFPKRFFDLGEDAKLLSELELCPSASLFVTVTAAPQGTLSVPGLSTASSFVTSTLGAVGNAASRVASWLPTLSGNELAPGRATTEPPPNANQQAAGRGQNPSSMAEIRRRESRSRDGNQYYNGNGTQFNGEDDDAPMDATR
jgi:UBX domain